LSRPCFISFAIRKATFRRGCSALAFAEIAVRFGAYPAPYIRGPVDTSSPCRRLIERVVVRVRYPLCAQTTMTERNLRVKAAGQWRAWLASFFSDVGNDVYSENRTRRCVAAETPSADLVQFGCETDNPTHNK
jgi:hypothetical protein